MIFINPQSILEPAAAGSDINDDEELGNYNWIVVFQSKHRDLTRKLVISGGYTVVDLSIMQAPSGPTSCVLRNNCLKNTVHLGVLSF